MIEDGATRFARFGLCRIVHLVVGEDAVDFEVCSLSGGCICAADG